MTPAKAAGPKKAAGAKKAPAKAAGVKKAAPPVPTIKCPKCQIPIALTEDRKAFNEHFADCGEMVKVVVMATFTVRLGPDATAQLPRLHAYQVANHAHKAIQGLIKALDGRPGVREVLVRRA